MPEVTRYQQGTPSWVDLLTTDQAAAEKFYGQLFGWEAKREPVGKGRFYSIQYLKTSNKLQTKQIKRDFFNYNLFTISTFQITG